MSMWDDCNFCGGPARSYWSDGIEVLPRLCEHHKQLLDFLKYVKENKLLEEK